MKIQTVYTEITNRCNLNCVTCYNSSGRNIHTQEMSIDQIESILKLFSRYGANRFLFSGGEPSLHTHFYDLLQLIDRYPQFSYGFVTNGTVHNEEWIKFLNSHQNITMQISLDGASEETNSLTRGSNNFGRAVDFVSKLRPRAQKPLLKMVVSQNNIDDVEKFYRMAISLDCVPEFAFIYKSGNGAEVWEQKNLSPQQKLSVIKTVRSLNREYDIDAYLPMCTVRCPYTSDSEHMSICIKTSGSIQPCQSLYSEDFSIGNVLGFDEQDFLRRVDRIINIAKERLACDYGCKKCLLQTGCGKGCLAQAVNNFGDPLAQDGDCLFRKLQFLDMYAKPL